MSSRMDYQALHGLKLQRICMMTLDLLAGPYLNRQGVSIGGVERQVWVPPPAQTLKTCVMSGGLSSFQSSL